MNQLYFLLSLLNYLLSLIFFLVHLYSFSCSSFLIAYLFLFADLSVDQSFRFPFQDLCSKIESKFKLKFEQRSNQASNPYKKAAHNRLKINILFSSLFFPALRTVPSTSPKVDTCLSTDSAGKAHVQIVPASKQNETKSVQKTCQGSV